MTVKEARSDAKVGGSFYVLMIGDKEYPHEGTYKEVTPHSRLVFTWMAPWSHPDSTVELTFNPVDQGHSLCHSPWVVSLLAVYGSVEAPAAVGWRQQGMLVVRVRGVGALLVRDGIPGVQQRIRCPE
jgi:uncharacterized protein YndB with AHSA1/START domain